MANSIKISDIKKELSNDEKVLESAFKLESLYKKYKLLIWSVIIVFVVFFAGRAVMDKLQADKLNSANEAFLTLQKTPTDTDALATLKDKNFALYELVTYKEAVKNRDKATLSSLASSTNSMVSDASRYALNALDKKPSDSKLYGDLTLFEEAYLDIEAGKNKEAKRKLELIDERSSLGALAGLLKHSTIKAK